ncbi:MAG TPA: GSCFA domain-containing protein [Puia sp.]|jgi:hypothetical protein
MELQLPIRIDPPDQRIGYTDKIMLIGSCFTEHIGNALQDLKFQTLQNPNGILFDPVSVAGSLVSYIHGQAAAPEDLVFFNELWQSWQHHSVFSHIDREACLRGINEARARAHAFLKEARWLVVTLGSAFSYRLAAGVGGSAGGAASGAGLPVANCHRAPAQTFEKRLLTIEEINSVLDNALHQLRQFNPGLQVILTVSPVRHIRDGVIENNRSKARLIETVHHLVNKFDGIWYFPAYELVIDVLRDYRFYDIDMVHPNYAATSFVLEQFSSHFIDEASQRIMEEVRRIVIARKHKAFQPATQAHRRFLQEHAQKTKELGARYPFLDLREELEYFSPVNGEHP